MAEKEGAVQSSCNMDAENRTWKISIRFRKDQEHVIAAKAIEDDGELIFSDGQGTFRGSCCLAAVHGYSVEPRVLTESRITIIRSSKEDVNPAADDLHEEIWNVSVRSKKHQNHVEAATVKKENGRLKFTDLQGNRPGCFYATEVVSHLIAPARPAIRMVSSPADDTGQW
jgi:hypothetical protein